MTDPAATPARSCSPLTALPLLLVAAVLLAPRWAGFRGMVMGLRNADLVGRAAPGLRDGAWLDAEDPDRARPVAERLGEPAGPPRWQLLVFLEPT